MKDTTTIVVAVGLVVGAIVLATRKPDDAGDVVDDGVGTVCGNVGTLDKKAGAACGIVDSLVGPIVRAISGSDCARSGGVLGTWSKELGFTGRCRGKTVRIAGVDIPKWTLNWNSEGTVLCCGKPDSDPRCKDWRPGRYAELRGSCTDGFPNPSIRDRRTA